MAITLVGSGFFYMILSIILFSWVVGFAISFAMLRTEIASEGQPYTFGDRLLALALSLLSWVWVIVILVTAWCRQVAATGYWSKEIKPKIQPEQPEIIAKKPVKPVYN